MITLKLKKNFNCSYYALMNCDLIYLLQYVTSVIKFLKNQVYNTKN